jgi:hypothetical protein
MTQSQSQQSDYLPSLYEEETDQSSFLSPSQHLITPTPSFFSSYPIEGSEPDFLRPNNPIPPSLTRVGPDRRKAFVLYDNMAYTDWVDWWL